MAGSISLPRDPGLSHAEDYEWLRRTGIWKIEQLSGEVWTDYNEHDPGITILEAFCFALTDLGYRASFEIRDLLAAAPGDNRGWEYMFYAADRILSCNPVTLLDFRKLAIDVIGVRNAWVERSGEAEVPVYIGEGAAGLTLDAENGRELLPFKGLYRVLVEFEEEVMREERSEVVLEAVKDKLLRHRNLCEDFVSISEIEYDYFSIDAEIIVRESADIELVNAQVYKVIRDLFSPSVNFYTLQQMIQKGYAVDEIFEGPLLDHGFIDSKELQEGGGRKEIRLSDIIRCITEIDGVIAVERLAIPKESQSPFSGFTQWVRAIKDQEKMPRLNVADSSVSFKRVGDRHRHAADRLADQVKVEALLRFLLAGAKKVKLKNYERSLPVEKGEYMDPGACYAFQRELPDCYGMEEQLMEDGAGSEGLQRLDRGKMLVLQSRGFLMLMEQVMADYLAQLAHIRDIFSFDPAVASTCYTQLPEGVRDIEVLFKDMGIYQRQAQEILENRHAGMEKRNQILDHLLARFGENMDDQSGSMRIMLKHRAAERLVGDKEKFLRDYIQISNYRGTLAGVRKRICRLLGLNDRHEHLGSSALYIDEIRHENNIVRWVVRLEDPADRQHVLLHSVEYEFRHEAEAILNHILHEGSDRHLYNITHHHGRSGYHLRRAAGEGDMETVASASFEHREDMERSFERTIEVLTEFSERENFHLLEHILLRPRISTRGLTGKGDAPLIAKETVNLLPLQDTARPAPSGTERPEKAPYHFKMLHGKEGWTLTLMGSGDDKILAAPESFLIYKHLTRRMEHIRSIGSDKANYHIGRNADNYYTFSIMDGARVIAEGRKRFKEEQALDQELEKLVKYFSFELQVLEDDEDTDKLSGIDPYSFHVTVVLPAWPRRFRDPGFRHLLEKTLYLELPAHIYPHVFWLEHSDMRRFEIAHGRWQDEQGKMGIPNTEIVNNLLFVLDELRKQQ